MTARLRSLRVLVADPLPAMAEITAAALKGIGVGTIAKVVNSAQAIRALNEMPFSVVIFADDLKPLGSTKLTAQLREMQGCPNRDVPVIAIGNVIYRATLEEAKRVGVARVVSRPISAEMLRRCLLSVLPATSPSNDQAFL